MQRVKAIVSGIVLVLSLLILSENFIIAAGGEEQKPGKTSKAKDGIDKCTCPNNENTCTCIIKTD